MKIKRDFVTNSSSVCYLIGAPTKNLREAMEELINKIDGMEEASDEGAGVSFSGNTIEELKSHAQGRPWDWASKARGLEFVHMNRYEYEEAKKIIDKKHHAMIVLIDNCANHIFDEEYDEFIVDYLW